MQPTASPPRPTAPQPHAAPAPQADVAVGDGPRFLWRPAMLAGGGVVLLLAVVFLGLSYLRHPSTPRAVVKPAVASPGKGLTNPRSTPTVPSSSTQPSTLALRSWRFDPLSGRSKRVLIGLFNPGGTALTTDVRIRQDGHVLARHIRIPAGKTVNIEPAWLTTDALTVQVAPSVVAVRVQTR